ncbi:MAG: DHH family phosphoesterase [Oscillospiraceae bacterium]
MNKKLIRLFEPGMKFYFIVMFLFAAASAIFGENYILAAVEGGAALLLLIWFFALGVRRRRILIDQIETITSNVDAAGKDSVANFPLPTAIIRLDNEEVIWTNERFKRISDGRKHLFEVKISELVPEFSTRWLLEGKPECPSTVTLGSRKYTVFGNLVRSEIGGQRSSSLIGTTYWMDITDHIELREKYLMTRPVVCIIVLDNYDELTKNLSTSMISTLQAEIDERINDWLSFAEGLLCKYDRDRYLFIFEEKDLVKMQEEKFSLLENIRKVVSQSGMHATTSLGFGKDGGSFLENYQFASLAIEMALSRGGDQAVIKNRFNFEFYGGRSGEKEKRTKVRSRVMASALGELMSGASHVLVMGHAVADLDSVGAAVGVCCAARKRGRKARIVIDLEKNNAKNIIEKLQKLPEYEDCFLSPQDAMLLADTRTLLVVVDTNRPEQVESQELLFSCNHVAVIDHHRRAATYIKNAALNFQEPYASSASELITELLQYITETGDIIKAEAEAMMAGIMLDTKNFTMRVGSRTFEAAAWLRRCGADPIEVKKLMQNDFESTVERYAIISSARMVRPGISVAAMKRKVDRVTAAQAADELLSIEGISTSFVLYPDENRVMISARSMGDVNVQVIMEKLGGGGNNNTAAAQVLNISIDEAINELLSAISQYFET